jgi:hypothetical protein
VFVSGIHWIPYSEIVEIVGISIVFAHDPLTGPSKATGYFSSIAQSDLSG